MVEYLLTQAEAVDVVVAVIRSYYEPLCAVYRRSCIASIEDLIYRSALKVSKLYKPVRSREVSEERVLQHDPQLRAFVNPGAGVRS